MQRVIAYGNDQAEATARADDIAALKGSGVAGLIHPEPGQKAFEVIQAANAGTFFSEAMAFLESWQTSSVLAGFLGLVGAATGGKGSFALSQDQSSFFLQSRQAVAKEIEDSISYDLIRPLTVLNFGTRCVPPTWKFGPLQDEQAAAILTMFQTMSAAPALNVPVSVFDLITERMAAILQLDVDQVHAALTSTAAQRAEQLSGNPPPGMPPEAAGGLGQLQGLTQAAGGLVRQAARQGTAPGQPGGPQVPGGLPRTPVSGPHAPQPGSPVSTPPPGRPA
jgi:hypothetical protein